MFLKSTKIHCVGIALCLAGATAPPLIAQESGKKLALLVGINRYPSGSGFSSLPFPQRDVDQLAGVLLASGYRPEHVRVLTLEKGSKEDPRFLPIGQNILAEFNLLAGDRKPEDSLLIALVGHGLTRKIKVKDAQGNEVERSTGFFCPLNADIRDTKSMIALDDIYAALEQSKAGVKVMLVDACRDNPTEGNTGGIPFAPPSVPASVAALFSCSDGEVAWEDADLGGGHGVFFHYVNEGLKGAADQASGNRDGKVSLAELTAFTQDKVLDFVSHRRGRRQMPTLQGRAGLVTLLDVPRGLSRGIITNSLGMKFAPIKAGEFQMGSPDTDKDASDDEKPQHRVRITRPFYLGVHEVTRGQFRRFVDDAGYQTEAEKDGKGGWGYKAANKFEQNPRYTWLNPGFEQTDLHPVVNVSWNDAVAFAKWLSQKEGKTYRLPTEAEWEYACRAGTTTRYFCGDDAEGLAEVGNVADGTAKAKHPDWTWAIAAEDGFVYTSPVGHYRPKAWGLYDMHGNVCEWCWDWYGKDFYKTPRVDDPAGPLEAADRVVRVGCWYRFWGYCRSAKRDRFTPDFRSSNLGFRLALVQ